MTWGARADASAPSSVPGAPLPAHGKPLGKLNTDDLNTVIEKGLLQYSKSQITLDIPQLSVENTFLPFI